MSRRLSSSAVYSSSARMTPGAFRFFSTATSLGEDFASRSSPSELPHYVKRFDERSAVLSTRNRITTFCRIELHRPPNAPIQPKVDLPVRRAHARASIIFKPEWPLSKYASSCHWSPPSSSTLGRAYPMIL
jgi:hypothetical protein